MPDGIQPNSAKVNIRMGLIFLFTFFCFVAVAGKLVVLQLVNHSYYAEKARKNAENKLIVPAKRGSILDRKDRVLAKDVLQYSIALSGKRLKNRSKAIQVASNVLNISPADVAAKINKNKDFAFIAHKVLPAHAEKLKELKDPGIILEKRFLRVYPFNTNGAHILGFCDVDNQPLGGIEYQYNDFLQGKSGWSIFQRDALGTQLPDLNYHGEEPIDGFDVSLTIDIDLQIILDDELGNSVSKYRAADGIAILMDPHTGEILAMSNYPSFNPARPNRYDTAVLKNRAVNDVFEPGSTLKIVTLAAALEVLHVNLDKDIFFCENGRYKLYGHTFTDYKPYGWLTARKVFENSSNIGAVKIAEKLKKDVMYRYLRNFGFGIPSGIDLPGESTGLLNSLDKWSRNSHLFLSFGYEVGITPIQLVNAYAVLANGGKLLKPYVMKNIRREKGRILEETEPDVIRRVLSSETTEIMNGVLVGVVENGSGKEARVPGVSIAGKTGTAQLYSMQSGSYDSRKHLASFAGYIPAHNPRYVLLVMIRQPQGAYYGGLVAAPIFRRVTQRILSLSGVEPVEYTKKEQNVPVKDGKQIPDLRNFQRQMAEEILEDMDLDVDMIGEGDLVVRQEAIREDGKIVGVALHLSETLPRSNKIMPALTGKSLKEALNLLSDIDMPADIDGHGIVIRQHPKAGSRISSNKPVKLVCKPS